MKDREPRSALSPAERTDWDLPALCTALQTVPTEAQNVVSFRLGDTGQTLVDVFPPTGVVRLTTPRAHLLLVADDLVLSEGQATLVAGADRLDVDATGRVVFASPADISPESTVATEKPVGSPQDSNPQSTPLQPRRRDHMPSEGHSDEDPPV